MPRQCKPTLRCVCLMWSLSLTLNGSYVPFIQLGNFGRVHGDAITSFILKLCVWKCMAYMTTCDLKNQNSHKEIHILVYHKCAQNICGIMLYCSLVKCNENILILLKHMFKYPNVTSHETIIECKCL